MYLTKKDIFKQKNLKREIIEIPEWGGSLIVQEMTALQQDKFEQFVMSKKTEGNKQDTKGMRVAVIIATVVDEEGKPIFNELDAPELLNKSGKIIDKIAAVGLRLSGMETESNKEQVKNSEPVPEEDLHLDSVEN